jgi:hypothetical protein
MDTTRKVFLRQVAGGVWLLALGGCGGGGSGYGGATTVTPSSSSGCIAAIADNHGHVLSIPTADLDSAVDKSYSIQGSADHTHQVNFSAAQLAQLKAGKAVVVTTSVTLDHSHMITESCA